MNLTPMRFQGKSIAKSHKFACRWWEKQTVLSHKIDCFTMKNRLFCSHEGLLFYHKHHAYTCNLVKMSDGWHRSSAPASTP